MAQEPVSKLPFLPFALPEIGEEEIAEVVDTLRSGWVTTGPKARRFETDFSAFLGDPDLHSIDFAQENTLQKVIGCVAKDSIEVLDHVMFN